MNKLFWKDRRVFITGHTGFKGSWLVMMLKEAGAIIGGYSKDIPTTPSFFESCNVEEILEQDFRGDICNHEHFKKNLLAFAPEIMFHLAAQPLVRRSYEDPYETYNTNVMGTLSVLMAANECTTLTTIINITTDKCYENKGMTQGYSEDDPMGGHDPYSSSKACAEILPASMRDSFLRKSHKSMATVRAGNVIGGGDWAEDRIVPDFIRSLKNHQKIQIRNPQATRPWQHVIEPLDGYIALAEKLFFDSEFSGAWNFGSNDEDCRDVAFIVRKLYELFPDHSGFEITINKDQLHEAQFLKLDCRKAKNILGWRPKLGIETALKLTATWYQAYLAGGNVRPITLEQIHAYQDSK